MSATNEFESEEKQNPVSIYQSGNGEVGIEGLTDEEAKKFEGVMQGMWWCREHEGRLLFAPGWKPAPGPAEDPAMFPFWRELHQGEAAQMQMTDFEPMDRSDMRAIIIQHLCGYNYTPDNYAKQARLLEGYGFECLRARRGTDGRYSEMWVLQALFLAKGDFEKHMESFRTYSDKKRYDAALEFLNKHIEFGTMSAVTQKYAMTIE